MVDINYVLYLYDTISSELYYLWLIFKTDNPNYVLEIDIIDLLVSSVCKK